MCGNEFIVWITQKNRKRANNGKMGAAFKMASLLEFVCSSKVLFPSPFLVSDIYTTMLAGLVMDVNILGAARR